MNKKQKLLLPIIALILAQLMWGANTAAIKIGLTTIPIPLYLSITLLGAAAVVAPFALKSWKPISRKDYATLTVGSVISISVGNMFLLAGLKRIPALNASLISLLQPMVLLVLSVHILKEKVHKKTIIGILIAFMGAAIIIAKPWASGGQNQLFGSVFIIAALLGDVFGTIMIKPVLKRVRPVQVTLVHLVSGTLPIAIYALLQVQSYSFASIGARGLSAVGFNILAVAFANCLYMYGLKKRKAHGTAIFQYIHPLAAGVAGWVILSEIPDIRLAFGAALIFFGVYFMDFRKSQAGK